jgi:hypothetical protein
MTTVPITGLDACPWSMCSTAPASAPHSSFRCLAAVYRFDVGGVQRARCLPISQTAASVANAIDKLDARGRRL